MTSLGLKRDNLYAYISKSAEEVKASEEQIEISHLDRFAEMDQNGTYSINPKEVLKEGLINRGITNIETSKVNTTYDYESYYGKEMGYNFTGGFIMSENNCKRLRLER
jgi:copper oxidase (laccase) domain-containing protein